MQPEFPGDSTIAQALPDFYRRYDLGADGGMSQDTVKIIFGKALVIYIPNIQARKQAVLKHDIHHIVTGYRSDFKGETEIGAWEVASGCGPYWVGWALNLSGMSMGVLFNLPGVFRAFIRGRRTHNLYQHMVSDAQALAMTVDELRTKLLLDKNDQHSATIKELLAFAAWVIIGGVYSVLSILFLPAIVIYSVVVALRRKK